MHNTKTLLSLPGQGVVKLDDSNPWLVHSVTGFTWGQLIVSNLCTCVVVAVLF